MAEKYKVDGISVTKYTSDAAGGKPKIVMVHGGEHASWCWENWATFLSEAGYEVHALDWYNHGDSDALPMDEFIHRSIADVARREIAAIIGQFDQKPILIGHSMGGLASAAYAAANSVERLVLVTPVMPHPVHPDAIPLPVDMTRPYPVFPYEQAKQLFFTTLDDEQAKRYHALLCPESPQAVHEATQWTVDFDPAMITVPTMVLATELDKLIPGEPLKHYADMLHAEYHLIEGIGHSDILLKEPEWRQAVEQVQAWLEK